MQQIIAYSLAFVINIVFGFFFEGIFIKKLSNKRYMLRQFWREIFHGSGRGRILSMNISILIIILEILFVAILTAITGNFFVNWIERTNAFFIPISIATLGSLYFYVKARFAPKLKWYDWGGYFGMLVIVGLIIWLMISLS